MLKTQVFLGHWKKNISKPEVWKLRVIPFMLCSISELSSHHLEILWVGLLFYCILNKTTSFKTGEEGFYQVQMKVIRDLLVTHIMIAALKRCPFISLSFFCKGKFSLSTWITGPKSFIFYKMKESFLKVKNHLKHKG